MFIIVMGVSGSGKTAVGQLLARRLGCAFYDGDDFHPQSNKEKMEQGIPLTDEDRAGWLQALAHLIQDNLDHQQAGVLACSALKESYRRILRVDQVQVNFIYLKGSYDLILERMGKRRHHYMAPGMLKSQFGVLEEPKDAWIMDIHQPPEVIVERILHELQPRN